MSKHTSNNARTRKRIRNSRLLEKLAYQGDIQIPTTVELIQYSDKGFSSKEVSPTDNLKGMINNEFVNWFKIVGISDANLILNICKSFGINGFDVRDMLSLNRVTKAITYENVTFVLTSECSTNNSQEVAFSKVGFILGENFMVSIQETTEPIFDDVKEAIQNSSVRFREKGADYLLYFLLNDVHSTFNDTIGKLADKIGEVEDDLISDNITKINTMRFIQLQKKQYMFMKRAMLSMREEYVNVLHNTNQLIKKNNMMYFNDFDDKLRTSLDDLEIFYLSIGSLSDLYFNNNNMKMNAVIKKLTLVSTIFIPLTFVVGVWGMNFKYMPELDWKYGYLYAWGVMLLIIILAIFYLKHKKWF